MKTPRGAEKKLPLQGSPAKLARAIDAILFGESDREFEMRFRDLAARLARRCESGTEFRFARCRPCERRDPYAAAAVVGKDRQRRPRRTIPAGGYGCPAPVRNCALAGTTEDFRISISKSRRTFAISRRHLARGLLLNFPPSKTEGAGKTGCALHPRSRVQSAQQKAHTSIQVQRKHSGLPCAVA